MDTALLLGSGGWIPFGSRATCCAMARSGDHALVLDAGSGLGRLVEAPDLLAGVRTMDIVLTHFHLDHVVGLAYLPALPLPAPPRIHGPGEWLYGASTGELLGRLVGHPFFAVDLDAIVSGVEEVDEAGVRLGAFDVSVRVQERHNDPTLAVRIGDELAYCTDTSYDPGNEEFASGVAVLLHEAWYTEDAPREEATHSSAREAARVAAAAGAGRLVLIHVRPGADEEALLREARDGFEHSDVGTDLLPIG